MPGKGDGIERFSRVGQRLARLGEGGPALIRSSTILTVRPPFVHR